MNRFRLCTIVAGLALARTVTALSGAELPFSINTRDGQWRAAPVQKPAAAGITFEMLVAHVSGAERLVILSAPLEEDGPETLSAFARRVKDGFAGDQAGAKVTEKDGEKMGYRGRELVFDMTSEKGAFDCVLFVFVDAGTGWGVLHAKLKNSPAVASAAAPFTLLQKKRAAANGVVALEPFRVKDDPVSSYPISFSVRQSSSSTRVVEITITDVTKGSWADRQGVKIGDTIVKVNGRKTQEFTIGTGKDSELGRIFLNQPSGSEVTLELLSVDTGKPNKVTLRSTGAAVDSRGPRVTRD